MNSMTAFVSLAPAGRVARRVANRPLVQHSGVWRSLATTSRRAVIRSSAETSSPTVPKVHSPESAAENWDVRLLYDSGCPLCLKEVNFLERKDAGRGLVYFEDIAALDYEPSMNAGISYEKAMGRIHAVRRDGTVIDGVEVFREVYEVLGMGWVYAATKWPLVGPAVDKVYDIWADMRLRMTGRKDLAELVKEREVALKDAECASPKS